MKQGINFGTLLFNCPKPIHIIGVMEPLTRIT